MTEPMPASSSGWIPALLGGTPARHNKKPIGTAQLAPLPVSEFSRLLTDLLSNSANPNHICDQLARTLADFHSVKEVVLINNASVGLLLALDLATRDRSGGIALPSFSFRGLPYICRMLKRKIRFVDVLESTGTMDPVSLQRTLHKEDVAAVLAVHNVDRPCDAAELEKVASLAGTPLVFDSVYSMLNLDRGVPVGSSGMCEVFSLHATKLINGFEGGYITTNDRTVAHDLRRRIKSSDGAPFLPSEIDPVHAAAALCSLGNVASTVAGNKRRAERYAQALAGRTDLRIWPDCGGTGRNFGSVLVEILDESPLTRDQIVELLCADGYLARPYYGPALHQLPLWAAEDRAALPVTERLSTKILQLPVGDPVSLENCDEIALFLRTCLDQPDRISKAFQRRAR